MHIWLKEEEVKKKKSYKIICIYLEANASYVSSRRESLQVIVTQ